MNKTKVSKPPKLKISKSTIFEGDALTVLSRMPSKSVQCVVTSPPYWGLRDYGINDQIGLEETLPQFINRLVSVFSEAKRVLKDDGVLWLNIGDGYTSGNRRWRAPDKKNPARAMNVRPDTPEGLKPKDLQGIPWRLAFALQDDGWYLRVKDRPTRSHEYIFMFSKSEKYFYDRESVLEDAGKKKRNRRTVWNVNTQGFPGAHFATFPPKLIEPCILASTKPRDYVLDPFFGSGTAGVVAKENSRKYIGIELHPEYVSLALDRLKTDGKTVVRVAA